MRRITGALTAAAACLGSLVLVEDARAQARVETVHTFSGNRGRPLGALAQGQDGRLYGSTIAGGFFGKGTIYATDGAGTAAVVHEFRGSDGEAPRGALLRGSDGAIYGTTSRGGETGVGTVFRIAPDGTFTTLAHFNGANGANPEGGLVEAADGHFYGTTTLSGARGFGTVFRITASGAITTLVSFDSANGAFPAGSLTLAADGSLYGATPSGGPSAFGTIFRVTLDGTLTTVVAFDGANGAEPSDAPVQATDGNLYGTTQTGGGMTCSCGTIYRITLDGLETLVSFTDANGALPTGALRQLNDGHIYGTTREGGAADAGTVFRLSLDRTFTSIASFDFDNGAFPRSGVIQAASGAIFGTTESGGLGTYGTVFELQPDGSIRTVVSFTGAAGADPSGRLTQASDGHFYGTTVSGGEYGFGTVFRMTADGFLTTIASFGRDTRAFPSGGLMEASDGLLYGTTDGGGNTGDGTIFRVTLDGTLTTLASFDILANGAAPSGGLIEGSDGYLYGTTFFGAIPPDDVRPPPGGVFRFDRSDNSIASVANFAMDGLQGAFPGSGLVEAPDGNFYGTAEAGGVNGHDVCFGMPPLTPPGCGTVFRVSPGAELSVVVSLGGSDGSMPAARLAVGSDGHLYGTTSAGGDTDSGTLFRLALDGTLTTLASLDSFSSGAFPYQQGVVEGSDGSLYGSTMAGGAYGFGTVYRWSAESGVATVHDFDGITGDGPNSTLIRTTGGALYGTAIGPQGGVIYRVVSDNAASALAAAPVAATYGGTATLSATLTVAGAPVAGAEIAFTVNGVPAGSVITDSGGIATLADFSIAGIDAGPYPGAIAASFAGSDGVQPAVGQADLTIARATPSVAATDASYVYDTMPHPASGTVTGIGGEVLGPLTFTYNGNVAPPVDPGSYAVIASFAGNTNYEPASATAIITIMPAPAGLAGLIAAYGFNEGAGSVAGDASGNGRPGRIKRPQWTANGRFGGALEFNGASDWVTVSDAAALDFQTALTIEAWVRPQALSGWNTIVLKEGDDRLAYALYANDMEPRAAGYVQISGIDQSITSDGPLELNAWSHLAMTYNSMMFRLYVNGVEVGRRALSGRIETTGGALRIGGNAIWGEYFHGVIDEVRIYGRELSATEIARDMNLPIAHEFAPPSATIESPLDGAVLSGMPSVVVSVSDNVGVSSVQLRVDGVNAGQALSGPPFTIPLDAANGEHVLTAVVRDWAGNVAVSDPVRITIANVPVADYTFEAGVGPVVLDASGQENHGTMSGGVRRTIDAARGWVLSFNGIDGLVSVADAASLDLTTAMTLEAWVRPTAFDDWRTVLLKEADGVLSYALYANDEENDDAQRPAGYVRINGIDRAVKGRRRLAGGIWTHLAMTYDGTTMRMYVNGAEVASRTHSGAAQASAGHLRIGGNRIWGEWFKGQMDNVRIYPVAVGAAQIKADMNR